MSTIKSYNQLPSTVKQTINNVAARAAQNVVNQSKSSRPRPRPIRTASRKATINSKDARESRVHRRELWFETTTQGLGTKVFDSTTFPEWFASYSKLYETYQMHSVKVHWTTGYSKFVGGYTYVSYNTNPSQSGDPFSISSIFAQQNAGKSQVAADGEITIPKSAYLQQPNRRQCSGPGSYLFDLRYYISASDYAGAPANGSITFWIEYDCTFYTPQSAPPSQTDLPLIYDSATNSVSTMNVTVGWTPPSTTTTGNNLSLTFSNGVPVGSKARVGVVLNCQLNNPGSTSTDACLGTGTRPTGVTVVATNQQSVSVPAGGNTSIANYFEFDVVVPATRSVTIPMATSPLSINFGTSSSTYATDVVAFVYA